MSYQTLEVERRGHVGWLFFNRPAQRNAMNSLMRAELRQAWTELAGDPRVRVIVNTGRGASFQTGADVIELATDGLGMERYRESVERFDLGFTSWQLGIDVPVIAAVNGVCAGGGLHFVADADIVLAAADASFTDPHVSVGQASTMETIALMRKMPAEAVLRMALTGRHERMSAARAYELGLVGEVVDPPERLHEAAQQLAEKIARNSPAALRATKRALWAAFEYGLTDACRAGAAELTGLWGHPDQAEGPAAFAEKREPRWKTELLAGEPRRPALGQRGQAFTEVRAARAQLHGVRLVGQLAVQVPARRRGQQRLGQPERDGRGRRQLRGQLPGRRVQPVTLHRRVYQPPVGGLGPAELAAEQQQLPGPDRPDDPGEQPGAARVGGEPAVQERVPEGGVAGRHGEVGGQRKLRADPGRPAADRAHHRQLQLEQQRDQPPGLQGKPPLDAPGPRPGIARLPGVAGHEVEPAAEVGPAAGDQHRPQAVVRGGLLEVADQRGQRHIGQRVALPAPVQRQPQHPARDLRREPVHRLVGPVLRLRHQSLPYVRS
jgi:enoyl-CoA hydratase